VHDGEPVLAALLGGFDGELLPLFYLGVGLFLVDVGDAMVTLQRREFGDAELGRLLDNEVHRLALSQRLREPDRVIRARRGGLGENLEAHLVARDLGDARLGFRAVAVKDGEEIAHTLPHDLRAVVGLFGVQQTAVEGGGVVAFHD